MSLLNIFRPNAAQKTTAAVAKERLQIILTHERSGNGDSPDYLPALKEELLRVIMKYVSVDSDQIKVEVERHKNFETLELNIFLPE